MPTLKWEAKDDIDDNTYDFKEIKPLQTIELIKPRIVENSPNEQFEIAEKKRNLLILGDNKIVMRCLLEDFSNKIDLMI